LKAEAAESAEILERLVDHGQADHGVDEIRVDVPAGEHTEQQRRAVPDREQRYVERHVFQAVQEEDDAREKQQVVVARHHVLRAEIQVGADVWPGCAQQERLIFACDTVRVRRATRE
jgi:hypothetical protein